MKHKVSSDEREIVLKELTEKEFDNLRQLLKIIKVNVELIDKIDFRDLINDVIEE